MGGALADGIICHSSSGVALSCELLANQHFDAIEQYYDVGFLNHL